MKVSVHPDGGRRSGQQASTAPCFRRCDLRPRPRPRPPPLPRIPLNPWSPAPCNSSAPRIPKARQNFSSGVIPPLVRITGSGAIRSSQQQRCRDFAAMTTRGSEVLKDTEMEMEDMFANPKKEWRNPLVLCGAIATAGVLVAGLASFRQGNFRTSQMLMRTRVIFQAATVALMVGTVSYQGSKS